MSLNRIFLNLFAFFVAIFFFSTEVKASHAQGADFLYQCLGGDTFKISLVFFRDCNGIEIPTAPVVNLSSVSCGRNQSLTLQVETAETEVSTQFLCPSQSGNSACNGGNLPGTTRTVFSAVVVLPQQCSDWVVSYDLCCRNEAVTNLATPGSQDIYVFSNINNANGNPNCNNSPTYGSLPIMYACAGRPFSYNPNAVDPDGDSLAFSLINPLNNPGVNIPYSSGAFSPTNPLTTSSGFQFNPLTGQMDFTPTGIQAAVVTVLVREFRNGVLVGSTIRDLQIVTVNCGAGNPPALSNIDSLSGGNSLDSLTVSVCPGEQVRFTIQAVDSPGDDLTLTTNVAQSIPGATFSVIDLGNVIRASFNWVPTALDTGIKFFSVTITDSLSCPIRSTITKTYVINVLDATSAGPDLRYCVSGGPVQLNAIGGTSFSWSPATGLSNPNIANPTASPSVTTNYIVTSNLSSQCKNVDTVTVFKVDDFVYSISNDTSICRNGAVPLAISTDPQFAPYQYQWTPSGSLSANNIANPIASPIATTDYFATITAANGCSVRDTVRVTISGVGPLVNIFPDKNNVCPGETIQLNTIITNLQCGPTVSGCSTQNPASTKTFGTGTTTSNTGTTPFQGASQDARTQLLYRASELNAAGINSGTIQSISFNVGTKASVRAYTNLTIKIACTAESNLSLATGFLPVSTTVFGPTNTNTQLGNNTFIFSTPYDWDGVSNLVIELCYDNTTQSPGGNDQLITTNTSYTSVMRNFVNNSTGCSLAAAFTQQELPNISFSICDPLPRNYTYTWVPTTGLSNPSILSPTTVLNQNATYTLNVDDGQCVSSATVNLKVDDSYNVRATIDPNFQCGNDTVQLFAEVTGTPPVSPLSCGAAGTVCSGNTNTNTIGIANATNTSTTYPAPFGDWYESTRQQYLYRASDLTAGGLTSGTITSLAFNVTAINGTTVYRNYTVKISCNNQNTLNPSSFVAGLVTVFNPKTVNITTGWNTLQFDNTFNWDGTSNIVVEICHNNNTSNLSFQYTNNSLVQLTNLTYTGTIYYAVDDDNACPVNTVTGGFNTRPVARFTSCPPPPTTPVISWTPSNTLNNPNIANPVATLNGTTTYTVAYTFVNGCTKRDSVTVSPASFNATVSNDTAICAGSSVTLTATGGNQYLWQPATGLSATNTASVIASPTQTTTYIVTITETTSGCIDRDTVTVTVNELPQIAFSGNNEQCFNATATIDAGSGFVSYEWQPGGQTTQEITVTSTGTYVVTVVDANGCSNSDEVVLNFGTPPVIDLGPDLAGCDGDEFLLDAGAGFESYSWSNLETSSSITVTQSGTYIVSVIDEGGCSARDTVTVTFFNTTISLGNDTAVCSGTIFTLTAGPIGPDYLWSTQETTPSILVTQTGNYSVTITVSGASTCTASDEIFITVNEPVVVDLGSNNITCNGNPLVLDAGADFASYTWSPNGETTQSITVTNAGLYGVTVTDNIGCTGSDVLAVVDVNPSVNAGNNQQFCQGGEAILVAVSNNQDLTYSWLPGGAITQSITVNDAGTYIVTATDANGCFSSDTVVVTVFADAVPNLGNDITICSNEQATLTAGNFNSYEWSPNGETTASINAIDAGIYSVTVTDANGCTGTDAVTVSQFAAIVLDLDDYIVCSGQSATITAPAGFFTYQWTNGATTQTIVATQAGEYILQVTDANGCSASAIANLDNYAYTLEVTATPSTINKGDTAQLSALVTGGSGNYSYTWVPATGLNNSQIGNPIATPEDTTTYTVYVADITTECAVDSNAVTINVISKSFYAVPDAFTPDGDGKNDLFEIYLSGNITLSEFKIYNRWGELIHNATSGWDGTFKGEQQPVGTYGYFAVLINQDGTKEIIKNAFTLIR